MIFYDVLSGKLTGLVTGKGYSGHDTATLPTLNNPIFERVQGVGPIPQGLYKLSTWEDYHPKLGEVVVELVPEPTTNTYGRSGFFIHGDNQQMDYTASDGCIILSKNLREALRQSGETELTVT